MSSDDLLLAFIQEAVRNNRYYFSSHALTKHPGIEGFTERDALEAIQNGTIIQHRPDDYRCTISGTSIGLEPSRDYVANFIHCVCKYDSVTRIVIITMYRPRADEWVNGFSRRNRNWGES